MEKQRMKTFRMVFLAMMVAIGVVISPILRIEGMCPTAEEILNTAIRFNFDEFTTDRDVDEIIAAIIKISKAFQR